ncbi:MAG: hypothetical protein JSS67_07460 [Bacteroidetes bacterium]|nr:hypothetical protein [Bacteroidota bacterium]
MKDKLVASIARMVFALVIGFFALNHILHAEMMVGAVPSFLPAPIIWVYIVGAALGLLALSLLIGVKVRLTGYLLGLLLLIILCSVHLPNFIKATEISQKMSTTTNLLKDLAMSAAAFYIGSKHK